MSTKQKKEGGPFRGSFQPGAAKPYDWQMERRELSKAEAQVTAFWKVGDLILDTYEVTGILGEGGMGRVYRVHHKSWNIDLAVKCPRSEEFKKAGGAENFIRECETWVNLGFHPQIVGCYYVRTLGGIPRVFAECIEGGSLKNWIDTRKLYQGGSKAALERMLDVAIQVARGLQFAHEQGLVHQDVKPANVMMMEDGTAKVTDFGLARARGGLGGGEAFPAGQSLLASWGGLTPAYCSPEQAGRQPLTRRTDVWSWGVSLLEMFTGEMTWRSGPAAAQALSSYLRNRPADASIPAMPEGLVGLLRDCFQPDPAARPKDMQVLVDRLQDVYQKSTAHTYARPAPQAFVLTANSRNNQALSLFDLGRREEAIDAWQANLQANPGHLESTYNLGLIQWRSMQKDDLSMLRDLNAAAASSEKWREGWLSCQVHLERGDIKKAKQTLRALPPGAALRPEIVEMLRKVEEMKSSGHKLLRTIKVGAAGVNCVSLSPDEGYALSGNTDGMLKLWEVVAGKCLQTISYNATSVCLGPDGRRALSGGWDKKLKLWDMTTGQCLRTFEGHTGIVRSVFMSSDERYAFSGSNDNTIKLWDMATGRCLRTLAGHTSYVFSVTLSADGRYALSVSNDKTLKLWDMASGRCLRTFTGHAEGVNSVCLSVDGRFALSGGWDNKLKLWDVATGECLRTFEGHSFTVYSAFLSPDGRHALSASRDKTLKLWDVATGQCLRTFDEHTRDVNCVYLSADGHLALSGSQDHTLRLWQITPGYEFRAQFAISPIVTTESARSIEQALAEAQDFRQRGDVLAEAQTLRRARSIPGYEHEPRIMEAWSRLYLKLPRTTPCTGWIKSQLKERAACVCLGSDGRRLVSGSYDGNLRLWDMASGECLQTFAGKVLWVHSVSMSADGRHALSGHSDKTLKLWDTTTGSCLRTFKGHTHNVIAVCLSADGRLALSGSYDKTLRLWDVDTGSCLRILEGHTSDVNSVCLSADGRLVLSGSKDKTLKLWDVATGQCLRTLEGHLYSVSSVCLSPDGRYAFSGSYDETLKLWDMGTGECLRTFKGHTDKVNSVCLSTDGHYALSGSRDKTLKLWDVTTGECLRIFEGHTSAVDSVCLAADGRYAVSGGYDSLRVWELDWELKEITPQPRTATNFTNFH